MTQRHPLELSLEEEAILRTVVYSSLFDWPLNAIRGWDVAPDGQSFVMIEPGEPNPAPTRLYLIMNWSEQLKRLVPSSD